METPLLKDIILIFGLSVGVLFLFHRIRVPEVVGFLFTGIIVGPHGLGLIDAVKEVEGLAEVGVVLLLFIIGIEFSLKKLLKIRKYVLLGGLIQVLLTVLIIFLVVLQLGISIEKAVFIGFLISLSSTAIVLKIVQDRAEIASPHGRMILAILIFQDIIFVPMMLIIPFLAGAGDNIINSLLLLTAKTIGIILFVIVGTKWIIPIILYQITKTRSNELFLLSMFVICFALAFISHKLGLSFALGGFLAGLIISESEYSHQAVNNILPFKSIFTSFFFISIGMLLDINFLLREPLVIILLTLPVLILKSIISCTTGIILGFPLRTSLLLGFSISQVGEFSFVLFETGIKYNLISHNDDIYHYILSITILTMTLTPFIIKLSPYMSKFLLKLPIPKKLLFGRHSESKDSQYIGLEGHLIIIGFGVNGRNLSRAAKVAKIPYVIIEMNSDTVKQERSNGEPIYFGDASYTSILNHVSCDRARVVVIAISDHSATKRIIKSVRSISDELYIIARTRFLGEVLFLYELGANDVIPQEYETSIEIFARVMTNYLVPKDEIEHLIAEIRGDEYAMVRSLSRGATQLNRLEFHLPDNIHINTLRVDAGSSFVNKSLSEVHMRKEYGITVLAIKRQSSIIADITGDSKLQKNDILILLGKNHDIAKLNRLLKNY